MAYGIKSGEGKKKFNLCVFSSVHVEGSFNLAFLKDRKLEGCRQNPDIVTKTKLHAFRCLAVIDREEMNYRKGCMKLGRADDQFCGHKFFSRPKV